MAIHIRRREFIVTLGGVAAAGTLAARAQQTIPVVGFVYAGETADGGASYVAAFRRGLREVGFVEGQNVAVEYRYSTEQSERLSALMTELVHRGVAVIVGNTASAMVAKTVTSTIPIVFATAADPVKLGLVASFNHPGGNATGVSFLASIMDAKRLGLLHDLLPHATAIAALVDPSFPDSASQAKSLQDAAQSIGQQIHVLQASSASQVDSSFITLAQQRADALIVAGSPFFGSQRNRIVGLAARHSLPAMYYSRQFPEVGGLISYGTNIVDAFHQAGTYVGRILKGEKPADLPVAQSTKFEFVINLKTAKALGVRISDNLLSLADEVIE
jgi:putative ABC transport system substrate-binding protein